MSTHSAPKKVTTTMAEGIKQWRVQNKTITPILDFQEGY